MFFILMLSTLLVISSSQWFMIWVFLELNTLCMCYMFSKDIEKEKLKLVSVNFYYCVQILSSLFILFAVMKSDFLIFNSGVILLILSMSMKMGLWPFHSWYLKMIDMLEMGFFSLWVMMTWQKLLPFFLLLFSNLGEMFYFFFILGLLNLIVSLIYLKMTLSIKNILGFSSVNSNSWLLVLIFYYFFLWKLFLFFYSLSMIMIMVTTKNKSGFFITTLSFFLFLMILNISGFPPFVMFWIKVLSVKFLLSVGFQVEMIMLWILGACYVIFFYIFMLVSDFIGSSLNMS